MAVDTKATAEVVMHKMRYAIVSRLADYIEVQLLKDIKKPGHELSAQFRRTRNDAERRGSILVTDNVIDLETLMRREDILLKQAHALADQMVKELFKQYAAS